MAKGFEELMSDAFAELFMPQLRAQQKNGIARAFAGEYPQYDKLKETYSGLSLTSLYSLLEAFKAILRHQFVHPIFFEFANSDLIIPVWHHPEIGPLARKALDGIDAAYKEKGGVTSEDYAQAWNLVTSANRDGWINTSQPTLILEMLALANLRTDSAVLEVGSGCGYLAALAAKIAQQGAVYCIEKIPALANFSQERLRQFGNVHIYQSNALEGLPEELAQISDLDAIIFSAGTTEEVARSFATRLKTGGRAVAPIQRGTPEEIAKGRCLLAVYIRTEAGYDAIMPEKADVKFTLLK